MRHRTQGPGLDGVLLIDKPAGPTSHDVVARIRRTLGQQRIGHTGTLDPLATGLLALVVGRATKLASVLTAGRKTYEAIIRLGVSTTTDDAEGERLGAPVPVEATDEQIRAALEHFRGPIAQVPPAHSAKKVGGQRAYTLARRSTAVELKPVTVTVHELEWLGRDGDSIRVGVTASSGFYVRSLARDLGVALGCGGHLSGLRRTASGPFVIADAVPLDVAERIGQALAAHLIPPAQALPHLAAITVTDAGLRRIRQGAAIGPEHFEHEGLAGIAGPDLVRLLAADGSLVALGKRQGGALHPVTVLG